MGGFLTRHVIYSKIIPKSSGLATSKRKTSYTKFLIILINLVQRANKFATILHETILMSLSYVIRTK